MKETFAKRARRVRHVVIALSFAFFAGCFATPEQAREHCLEHAPIDTSAATVTENIAGNVLTLGVLGRVNEGRLVADCATILGDEQLKQSCPDRVVLCEQFLAERKARAGATRVNVTQVNRTALPPSLPQNVNCVDTGVGVNCQSC